MSALMNYLKTDNPLMPGGFHMRPTLAFNGLTTLSILTKDVRPADINLLKVANGSTGITLSRFHILF